MLYTGNLFFQNGRPPHPPFGKFDLFCGTFAVLPQGSNEVHAKGVLFNILALRFSYKTFNTNKIFDQFSVIIIIIKITNITIITIIIIIYDYNHLPCCLYYFFLQQRTLEAIKRIFSFWQHNHRGCPHILSANFGGFQTPPPPSPLLRPVGGC